MCPGRDHRGDLASGSGPARHEARESAALSSSVAMASRPFSNLNSSPFSTILGRMNRYNTMEDN